MTLFVIGVLIGFSFGIAAATAWIYARLEETQ